MSYGVEVERVHYGRRAAAAAVLWSDADGSVAIAWTRSYATSAVDKLQGARLCRQYAVYLEQTGLRLEIEQTSVMARRAAAVRVQARQGDGPA